MRIVKRHAKERRLAGGGWVRRPSGLVVPRRAALSGGLASFAAILLARTLPGCSDDAPAGRGGAGGAGSSGSHTPAVPSQSSGGGAGGGTSFPVRDLPDAPALVSLIADIGPLGEAGESGVRVADGFTARVLARSQEKPHAGSDYAWHLSPDGGATYRTEDGGWIYVSNAEVPVIGGAGAIRFDASGEVVGAYPILADTNINCAGGLTPWHTWLSCEEIARGQVFECDPWGEVEAVARPALGVFKHEAAAVDPERGHVYLTEDVEDGRFYRFTADREVRPGVLDLSSGKLEVLVASEDGDVTWVTVPDPAFANGTPTREQIPESKVFEGGEGIWYHRGIVYFSTKGTNQVWALDVERQKLATLYDEATSDTPILHGVDNITVSASGDVLVAEDGGDMEICAILPDGTVKPLVQVVGHDGSEITGPAFDPSGTRLYFSSQRGPDGGGGGGVTFEVTGPFHEPA
jgi:hypothetical protein